VLDIRRVCRKPPTGRSKTNQRCRTCRHVPSGFRHRVNERLSMGSWNESLTNPEWHSPNNHIGSLQSARSRLI
jgi:hypothetical protein